MIILEVLAFYAILFGYTLYRDGKDYDKTSGYGKYDPLVRNEGCGNIDYDGEPLDPPNKY